MPTQGPLQWCKEATSCHYGPISVFIPSAENFRSCLNSNLRLESSITFHIIGIVYGTRSGHGTSQYKMCKRLNANCIYKKYTYRFHFALILCQKKALHKRITTFREMLLARSQPNDWCVYPKQTFSYRGFFVAFHQFVFPRRGGSSF